MVHRPTWVGNVRSCVGVNFLVSTFGLLVDNIGPAIADQSSDGWHCQVTHSGPARADQLFWRGWSLEEVWDARVACGEDRM